MKIKLFDGGQMPVYKTSGAACCDCFARVSSKLDGILIRVGTRALIPIGFAIELPEGYEAVVRPRSGLSKDGIDEVLGTIDCDYRGEISAIVVNNSDKDLVVHNGDRICQLKIQKAEQFTFEVVDELSETERGDGGFGHTGLR